MPHGTGRKRSRGTGAWTWLPVAAVVLALGLFGGGPAVAADSSPDRAELRLTLAEAIELAFEYDVDHEIARLNWDNARIDNLIAKASGPVSPYETLQRELQERRAQNSYVSARNSLVLAVLQDYFDLKQARHQADNALRQLEIARRELDVVREMVRIGERHPQDELREQNRVAASQLSAETAARTLSARTAAFLHRLGLDEDIELVLTDEPWAEEFDWSLEETMAYALEHSFSVWERDMNRRIAAMDFDALKVQDPAPLQLQKAENNFRVSELNAMQAERTFRNNVTNGYFGLADAARRLESAAVDFELAQAAFESARRQHEAGLTTDTDWERAQLDLRSAEQSHRDSVLAYMRARLDLLNLIGHPLGLGPAEEQAEQ